MNSGRRVVLNVWVLLLAAGLAGCSSTGYWSHRGRDAADIFTLTIGTGGGAKLRAGPLQLAVMQNADLFGLRAGQWLIDGNGLVLNDEIYAPVPLFPFVPRIHPPQATAMAQPAGARKPLTQEQLLEQKWITSRSKWTRLFGEEAFSHGINSTSERRGKNVLAKSPFPIVVIAAGAPYYSQIEVAAGFIFTLRAGFNPGELLDFILGWSGLDIYTDDAD